MKLWHKYRFVLLGAVLVIFIIGLIEFKISKQVPQILTDKLDVIENIEYVKEEIVSIRNFEYSYNLKTAKEELPIQLTLYGTNGKTLILNGKLIKVDGSWDMFILFLFDEEFEL